MRKNLHNKIMLSILAGSLALGFVYAPPAFAEEDVTIADGETYTAPDGTQDTYDLDADYDKDGTNYGDASNYTPITDFPEETITIGTFTVKAGNGGTVIATWSTGGNGGSISLSEIKNAIKNGVSITAGTGSYSTAGTGSAGGDVTLTFKNVVNGNITAAAGIGGSTFHSGESICTGGAGGDVTLTFKNVVKGNITATGGDSGSIGNYFTEANLTGVNGGKVTLTFENVVKGNITAKAGSGNSTYSNSGEVTGGAGGDVTLTFKNVNGNITAEAGNGGDIYNYSSNSNATGGNGGDVTLTFNDVVNENITAAAGNGGDIYNYSSNGNTTGGAGGDVTLTFKNVNGNITAEAGDGSYFYGYISSGNITGGNGGNVSLTFNDVVTSNIYLTSGTNGALSGIDNYYTPGNGGSVNFTAESISGTQSTDSSDNITTGDIDIELTKNDGDITFDVGTLNIADNTVKITAKGNIYTGIIDEDTETRKTNHINNLILTGNGDFKTVDENGDKINDITVGSLTINNGTVNDNNWAGFIDRTYYNDDGVTENNNIILGENGVTFDITSDKELSKNLTGSSTGNLTKTGAGTLKLTGSIYNYTGLTVVEEGTLDASATALANSKGLTLLGDTTFVANTTQDWNRKQIAVYDNGSDKSATYKGNLNAQNSNLYFIASGDNTNPLLSVTGSADISGSKYNIGFTGKTTFDEGQALTLIEAGGTIDASGLQQGNGIDGIDAIKIGSTITQSITDVTTVPEVASNGSKLIATLGSTLATDEASVLNASMLGGLAFNLQGADLIAREGMEAAVRSAQLDNNHAVFAALTRSSLDYGTIDVDGTNMLAGLAWRSTTGAGSLTYGIFAEHGDGSYDTYANINGISLHGEGDTDYTGGGILARMDFNGSENGHGYLEASGRVGNADTDYTNSGLRDAYGRAASYSTDGTYYGAHIGAGYVQKLDEKSSIDWYGKLLWARLEGGSADLSTGEHLTFDDADSLRLRIGGRWNYTASDFVNYYAGLGYEYEFDGEANGFTNGLALGDEDLTGGSGVAELGISFKPSKNSPFSLELNLAGFTGEREGFRGGVEAVYTF